MAAPQKGKNGKALLFLRECLRAIPGIIIFSLFGFFMTFFMVISPFVGYSILLHRKRQFLAAGMEDAYQGATVVFRAVIIGIFFTAAFIAPTRGLSYIVAELSEWKLLHDILLNTSMEGVMDGWLGACGICFAIGSGFICWRQGLLLKSQIVNIPTAKVRSAAMGIAEFKGVARQIEDSDQRLTVNLVDGEKEDFTWQEEDEAAENPIIHYNEKRLPRRSFTKEIKSRFYLEDDTGRILVDPRRAELWGGEGIFLAAPTQHFYLQEEELNKTYHIPGLGDRVKGADLELRQLYPGDEIYVIGSVEENKEAGPDAMGPQRLLLRPSSTLSSPDPISRIFLGKPKDIGSGMFNIFFLTDILEQEAKELLVKGIKGVWIQVAVWVALSLPPFLINFSVMFDGEKIITGFLVLKGILINSL